jgi:NAD(P)-dependent dehydrogenase (short-subunit alcohol dehydrogenase family)
MFRVTGLKLGSNIFEKFSLAHRTAVVTGGAGLLGRQFTVTLAQAGATVFVADLDLSAAQTQAESINQAGWKAFGLHVDVTDRKSVKAMVDEVVKETGRLDVIINNAAIDPKFEPKDISGSDRDSFETYPLQAWQDSLNVNLTGMFLMAQAAVVPMINQAQGVIINICSTYGLVGPDQRIYDIPGEPRKFKPVDYSVTKAGVLGFTRYLAAYYAGTRIRVNALSPGGVYNEHGEDFVKNYSARAILGRMANIDEMNGAILFLASDASSYMTGANLVVDGGWTAW